MSSESTSEVFTLELPVTSEVAVQDAASNAWKILGRVYKLAQTKLAEAAVTKLPPRDEVIKAAADAYDKYVAMLESAAKDIFVESVGKLYDGVAATIDAIKG